MFFQIVRRVALNGAEKEENGKHKVVSLAVIIQLRLRFVSE